MDAVREITASQEDLAFLAQLYDTLYAAEFPDPDERESLANMQQYLSKKAEGWYGASNYHILVQLEDGKPVGLSISDYLARANAGVIEFIVTDPDHRGAGHGRRLLDVTEATLAQDASRNPERSDARPFCIVAEMNDPTATSAVEDNLDPAVRARIWSRWGYRPLGFPYEQPALSPEQKPVTGLVLIAKPVDAPKAVGLAAAQLRLILSEYMRMAMRIDRPEATSEHKAMSAAMGEVVPLLPLA